MDIAELLDWKMITNFYIALQLFALTNNHVPHTLKNIYNKVKNGKNGKKGKK